MPEITRNDFKLATGFHPENDDLIRANCDRAGDKEHERCGWCFYHNRPVFMCGDVCNKVPTTPCTTTGPKVRY